MTSYRSSMSWNRMEAEERRSPEECQFSSGHRNEAVASSTSPSTWNVGTPIEREIDESWHAGTIIAVNPYGTYDIEYLDGKQEYAVDMDDLKYRDPSKAVDFVSNNSQDKRTTKESIHKAFKDSFLLMEGMMDYDPNKKPTVVIHDQGDVTSASGYVVNGPANNIASGNGLRGIRWLKTNHGD